MATFVNDTFTDSDGTDLSAHTGEVGATWAYNGTDNSGTYLITTNRAHASAGSSRTAIYASGAPASAEYDVQATITIVAGTNHISGVAGRMNISTSHYYIAAYHNTADQWELRKSIAGVTTILGTWAESLGVGDSRTVKLEIRDAAKKLYVDGIERISSADNAITAAGKAALAWISGGGGERQAWDNFTAFDPVSADDFGAEAFILGNPAVRSF
jgi:hypothetical protein